MVCAGGAFTDIGGHPQATVAALLGDPTVSVNDVSTFLHFVRLAAPDQVIVKRLAVVQ